MISCCWRCLSSLYFSWISFNCGARRCSSCIERNCLSVSGTSTARINTVSPTIAMPQLAVVMFVWMNTRIDWKTLISGENASWMTLARMNMAELARGLQSGVRIDFEQVLSLHRVVPTVAPRIAPQQAPHRKHEAPQYAVLTDRSYRIA